MPARDPAVVESCISALLYCRALPHGDSSCPPSTRVAVFPFVPSENDALGLNDFRSIRTLFLVVTARNRWQTRRLLFAGVARGRLLVYAAYGDQGCYRESLSQCRFWLSCVLPAVHPIAALAPAPTPRAAKAVERRILLEATQQVPAALRRQRRLTPEATPIQR